MVHFCILVALFVATLVQYFITSSSSPGCVFDAIRAVNESNTFYIREPVASKLESDGLSGSNSTCWLKLVTDLQPPETPISLHEQGIVMIVINASFSLIIIVFGLERA
ncbi:hypothetical protein TorRG33x02_024210 [Trema orientale]|uniref:Uncharacterized protein n=1 Tax=Trema orientale TaxID=63057 RepID=A0A2P5FV21_TREOI|nr:hypothetical protein TorRG33x02_024210 [Trema orientale]